MRKLPIGIQTFDKLREGNFLYVDKTAMIYQIASTSTPYFLSRPTFKDARICFKVWPSNSWKRNGKNTRFCTWI